MNSMQHILKQILIASGLIFSTAISVKAQSSNDFGIWSNLEVEKKIYPKWAVSGEVEFRSEDHSSVVDRWSIKLGSDYKIMKELKAGIAYQFLYFHDLKYSDFQPRHRAIGYIQGKKKLGNISISLRERFQVTTKDESDRIKANGNTDTYKINPEWCWRNKASFAYSIPDCKFEPSVSFESFYQLNNPEGNTFDDLRYVLSLAYKANKSHTLSISGILDKTIHVEDPVNMYILNVGYSYNF
jgi:hypothetical protein